MNLRPYPETKASGVDWLGDIPAHWEARKLKYILQERVEKGFPDEPLLVASQSRGVIRKDLFETRTMTAMKDLHLLKLVEVGDFVISLRSFQGGIEIAHNRGIISQAYTVLTPQTVNSGYLRHLFKSSIFIRALQLSVTGIREGQNINYTSLSREPVPLPPPNEQAAIVTFLDAAEKRIRRYIRAKQRLIKLLNEQKQAIIQQAVTRGLDPDVPMKDSGVEWLGEIPAGWEVNRLQWVTVFIQDIDHKMPQAIEVGVPFLSVKDLKDDGTLNFTDNVKQISEADFVSLSRKVQPRRNDIIYACIGVRSGRARLVQTDVRFLVSYSCYVIRPSIQIVLPEYLNYVLDSESLRRSLHMNGIGSPDLNKYKVSRLMAPIPSLYEQQQITDYANQVFERFKNLIQTQKKLVEQIETYRARLIADVVTGKVDVRGLAFEMPEDFDESDLLEVDEDELLDDDALEEVFDE